MVILVLTVDYLRVTHPFAMVYRNIPFDLHVLGMPPALILSQDQTLQKNLFFVLFELFAHSFLLLELISFNSLRLVRHI